MIGKRIQLGNNQFEFIRELGKGAFGIVYLVKDCKNGKEFAIKVIDKSKMGNRARREYEHLQSLKHKNIIELYDVAEANNDLLLRLEYVPGGDLDKHVRKNGKLSHEKAQGIFRQILTGVQYLHKQGIAHRDLKPLNILIGSNGIVKIADFGLANAIKNAVFQATVCDAALHMRTQCGTPGFCAPEVLANTGGYNPFKADVFSLGRTLQAIIASPTNKVKTLIAKLTHQNPTSRPTVDEILHFLATYFTNAPPPPPAPAPANKARKEDAQKHVTFWPESVINVAKQQIEKGGGDAIAENILDELNKKFNWEKFGVSVFNKCYTAVNNVVTGESSRVIKLQCKDKICVIFRCAGDEIEQMKNRLVNTLGAAKTKISAKSQACLSNLSNVNKIITDKCGYFPFILTVSHDCVKGTHLKHIHNCCTFFHNFEYAPGHTITIIVGFN